MFLTGTLITEPLDEPAPGVYIAAADTPAYGWLQAHATAGSGTYLGVKHAAGRKYVAVELDTPFLQSNVAGQMTVGPEYFTKALREYEDWRIKWWREAVQNGVDAGATEIECAVDTTADDRVVVSCADNGSGMDENVLLNKFLRFGGTTKEGAAGTRGGFGVAKELLILPWTQWTIHTRDRIAVGAGIEYDVREAPYRQGTLLEVVMAPDQTTHASSAIALVERCDLPRVSFRVIDRAPHRETVYDPQAKLKCKKILREFEDKAVLCHNKRGETYGALLVRSMGLYMFDMYVPSGVKGTLLVELIGPSIDLLTSNRDGFRDKRLKQDVQGYASELSADVRSALKAKAGILREKFLGSEGKYLAEREANDALATVLDSLDSVAPKGSFGRKLALSDEQVVEVLNALAAGERPEVPVDVGYTMTYASPELAKVMLEGTVMDGPTAVESAAKQLTWRLDFLLVNDVEGFRVPKKFRPETMTRNVRRLARTWGELCRFVLIQLGSNVAFGIGFVFDHDTGARYEQDGAEHWLLLNPFAGSRISANEDVLNPSNADDLSWLYAAAVHECTHMADGITYHDESFAAAMTRNVARTSGKDKQVRAIKRIVSDQEKQAAAASPRRRGAKRLQYGQARELSLQRADAAAAHWRRYDRPFVVFVVEDERGNEVYDLTVFASYEEYDIAVRQTIEDAKDMGVVLELRNAMEYDHLAPGGGKKVLETDPVR